MTDDQQPQLTISQALAAGLLASLTGVEDPVVFEVGLYMMGQKSLAMLRTSHAAGTREAVRANILRRLEQLRDVVNSWHPGMEPSDSIDPFMFDGKPVH